jgi:hypothetical protein
VGLVYSALDLDRHVNWHRWCFERRSEFGRSRERVRVEPTSRSVTLIRETRNVTRYGAGPRPVESGMDPALFGGRGGVGIERYTIVDSKTPIRERGVVIGDKDVKVFRPNGGVTAVVRDRVRNVPPGERPVAPPKAIEAIEERRSRLEEAVKTQRERLDTEHQQEMENRPAGKSAEELRRQQDAEIRAQREMEEREKRAMEEREKRAIVQRAKEQERQERAEERERAQREKAQPSRSQERKDREPPPGAQKRGDESKQPDAKDEKGGGDSNGARDRGPVTPGRSR